MDNITYGLNERQISDGDWFWAEVWLRANNNYGMWESEKEAQRFLKEGIREICCEAGWGDLAIVTLIKESKELIETFAQDMMME